jgi:serine/threonine protein kinase
MIPQAHSTRRRFHLQGCVGQGSFGEVYLATMGTPSGIESRVALKVLREGLDLRSQPIRRLRDEGRLLGVIEHPSVLRVHDLVVVEGRIALVSEYVDGQDLAEILCEPEPLPVRVMLELAGRVADALHAAYFAPTPSGPLGLVHRDIKPANLRLGPHGVVKVLDFGIARATLTQREAATEPGTVLGTYRYMAPEVLTRGLATPASDVYALGLTLFEGLTREHVFDSMPVGERVRLTFDEPGYDRYLSARLAAAGLPRPVTSLLYRTLDVQPQARPAHAELAELCQRLASESDGPTLEQWARERRWPEPRRVRGALDGRTLLEAPLNAPSTFSEDTLQSLPPRRVAPAPPEVAPRRRWLTAAAAFGVSGLAGLSSLVLAGVWGWLQLRPVPAPVVPPLASPISVVEPGPATPAPALRPVVPPGVKRGRDGIPELSRGTIEMWMAQPDGLRALVSPTSEGWRVARLSDDLRGLGLQVGDVLLRVNGHEIDTEVRLYRAWSSLSDGEITIELDRGGQRQIRVFRIVR